MKTNERNFKNFGFSLALLSAIAFIPAAAADDTTVKKVTRDDHVELQIGAATSGAGPGLSAGVAVQTNAVRYNQVNDWTGELDSTLKLQPRLEGSAQFTPSTGALQKASVGLTGANLTVVSSDRDPVSPSILEFQVANPKLQYSVDNRTHLTQGPSIDLFRVGMIKGNADALCGLLFPAYFIVPNNIGVAKVGKTATPGMTLSYNLDAYCSAKLGARVGELRASAGAEVGYSMGDDSDFEKIYGDVQIKKIAGSPVSAGVNFTHTAVNPAHDKATQLNEITATAAVAW